MKTIRSILKKKKMSAPGSAMQELDEKTIGRVFLEVAKGEIKSLEDSDIREIKLKNNILYIKTAHPVVSSELALRRERLLEKVNKITGDKTIEKIYMSS